MLGRAVLKFVVLLLLLHDRKLKSTLEIKAKYYPYVGFLVLIRHLVHLSTWLGALA